MEVRWTNWVMTLLRQVYRVRINNLSLRTNIEPKRNNCDVNKKYMKITKDAILEGSSQQANKDVINRRNGQGPQHLKFFLLVFLIWRPKPNKSPRSNWGPKPNTSFHHPSCLKRLLRARAQAIIDEHHWMSLFVISFE